MANTSRRIAYSLQSFRLHQIRSNPRLQTSLSSPSTRLSNSTHPSSPNGLLSRLLSRRYTSSTPCPNPSIKMQSWSRPSSRSPIGLPPSLHRLRGTRFSSTKGSNLGKFNSGVAKSVVGKPLNAVKSTFLRYKEAVGLQMEAFWKNNYLIVVGAAGVVVCVVLWRIMFGIASTFVGLSEGMAKYGFLALAAAMVSFAGMYIRSRITINPDKIYRIAMRKLNTSAGILEVMGAPLTGTDVRAYVMSGGRPKLKNFKIRFDGKRCFLIFPIRGSERRGLVSVEVKKKKGQYDMKLLAVDIPMLSGPDQRLFLIGDDQEYRVGGGLISELRDPIVKAMAAEKEFEYLDQKEEEEDEKREHEEAERKQHEDEEKLLQDERRRREIESLEKAS